jgi:hypothetical protein
VSGSSTGSTAAATSAPSDGRPTTTDMLFWQYWRDSVTMAYEFVRGDCETNINGEDKCPSVL